MPDMTGRELADALTALYPQLAVLYVSGYAASTIEEENLLGPGTSFLSKPFSVRALADKVREVLDGRTETISEHGPGDTYGGPRG
jgi:FixJ family two-component response regulator